MAALIVTVIFFTTIGAAAVALLRPAAPGTRSGYWGYAFLCGVAATGILLHFLVALAVAITKSLLVAVLLGALMIVVFRRLPVRTALPAAHPPLATGLLLIPFAVLLYSAFILPIRDYDGRLTWLPKARAIAHEGGTDGAFFRGDAGLNLHNHYPLAMPLNATVTMVLTRSLANESARFLYPLIGLASLLAVRDLLLAAHGRGTSWVIAAVAWLPVLTRVEGGVLAAYNDVALMGFIGIVAATLLQPRSGDAGSESRRAIPAIALFLSAAVLMKNEGTAVAIAGVLALAAGGWLRSWRGWAMVIAPVAGTVSMLTIWRRGIPPAYDEQYQLLMHDLPQLLTRLPTAVGAIASHAADFRVWGWFWFVAAAAAVVALARPARRGVASVLLLCGVLLASYVLAFTVTSWDIAELAGVAAHRLLTHVALAACCVIGAAVRPFESPSSFD